MSQLQFPSGQWVGFYTYAGGNRKHLMDLILEFNNGVMTGEGADGIGLFVISGNYSAQSGECAWVKQYVGRHAVGYNGFREGKGIWGNWKIVMAKGGFQIWPLSEGPPLKIAKESDEQENRRSHPSLKVRLIISFWATLATALRLLFVCGLCFFNHR
jgi:hypothetical protein